MIQNVPEGHHCTHTWTMVSNRQLLKKGSCLSEQISTPVDGLDICISNQATVFSKKYLLWKFCNIKRTVEVGPCPALLTPYCGKQRLFKMCLALRDFISISRLLHLVGCRLSVHLGGFVNCPALPTWQKLANDLFLVVGRGPLYQFKWPERHLGILKSESYKIFSHRTDQENDIIISSAPHKVNTEYWNGGGPQQHVIWSSSTCIKDQ